jgi:hypothetical protein
MGYDLRARNREVGDLHFGAFSWMWMLERGVGLIIGHSDGGDGRHIYSPRIVRGVSTSPMHNDGFPVSASEARAMALAARGLAATERHRAAAWEELPEATRMAIGALPIGVWKDNEYHMLERDRRAPVRADFIEKAERFAAWAEQSGGFRIY